MLDLTHVSIVAPATWRGVLGNLRSFLALRQLAMRNVSITDGDEAHKKAIPRRMIEKYILKAKNNMRDLLNALIEDLELGTKEEEPSSSRLLIPDDVRELYFQREVRWV